MPYAFDFSDARRIGISAGNLPVTPPQPCHSSRTGSRSTSALRRFTTPVRRYLVSCFHATSLALFEVDTSS